MEMFEIAKLLGLAIKESDNGKRLAAAKEAYEKDEQIGKLTTEFDVQQKAIAAVAGDKDADSNMIEAMQARITEIYEEVISTEVYKHYEKAQSEMNDLMSKINTIVMAQVNGVSADGCTHDCSTCGGCH